MFYLNSDKRKKMKMPPFRLFLYLALIIGALFMITPFIWSVVTSLKTSTEVFTKPPFWIPIPPKFSSYAEIIRRIPFLTYAFNTIRNATIITLGQLITCSLAGYAFARIRFPGKNFIFILFLSTMMVPFAVTMIPNFIIMTKIKLVNTATGLILPFIGSAYGTFLMRQFFLGFPPELEDAAKLDGCNPITFFYRILLPNAKPVFATLGIITFQWAWNEFQWALIMVRSEASRTLQLGLSFLRNEHYINWPLLMSASVLTNLPIIIFFLIAQKQFIESIKFSGLKG